MLAGSFDENSVCRLRTVARLPRTYALLDEDKCEFMRMTLEVCTLAFDQDSIR